MPGGRPRKPTRLKLLQGNPGKRKLPKDEPRPVSPSSLAAPEWLSGHAREEWERIAPEVGRLGLVTVLDLQVFAGYCVAYARWRQAKKAVEGESVDIAIARGLVRMEKEAMAQMEKLATAFGFTPASRSKVTGKPSEETDPFADWRVPSGGKKG